jgi:cell migration-inducing and hyaluronan-binding protein
MTKRYSRRRLIYIVVFALLLAGVACQRSEAPNQPPVTETDPDGANPSNPSMPETPIAPIPAEQLRPWSDPASWPSGRLPVAGEDVTIALDQQMLLDVSPPPLGILRIEGALVFDQQDLELTADYILVKGKLHVGTQAQPYLHRATITLTGDSDYMVLGKRFLGVAQSGELSLYGETRRSWTQLAQTADIGATSITLLNEPDWRVGDIIAIASTDFDFRQAERRTITRISGNRVTFDEPLRYMHFGELQRYAGRTIDQRAEVALLTRNIVVQGDEASVQDGMGGHVMVLEGGRAFINGVAFFRLGQRGVLGRYPLHYHLMADSSRGLYVTNSSIYDSFNRCLAIHGSHGILVRNNVAFNAPGHCFFIEDGFEFDNVFEDNLGMMIWRPAAEHALLASDRDFLGPSVYWIAHPQNVFRNNVAAGSEGSGFWLAFPRNPTGLSARDDIWPRYTPLSEFSGNVAHSNGSDGLHLDRGPDGSPEGRTEGFTYTPRVDPNAVDAQGRNTSEIVPTTFVNFTAYKNRGRGVWTRDRKVTFTGAIFADNAIGATFASHQTGITDSVFVGETANKGTPEPWMVHNGWVGLDGRTLPRGWHPDFTIRGFEFYDGHVFVENSRFAGFIPNSQRQAAAMSYLDYTHFPIAVTNSASGITITDNSNAVYLESRELPSDPGGGEDGYRSAVFIDVDGSVTGHAGRAVTANNPLLVTAHCSYREAWNSYICNERYASLTLMNEDPARQAIGPVTLRRDNGAAHVMLGMPSYGNNTYFRSSIILREPHHYELSGSSARLRLRLDNVSPGDSTLVSLPYSGGEVYLYRDYWIDPRNLLSSASSMAELTAGSGDKYYLEGGQLHLKLQVQSERDWAVVDVCQREGCR